MTSDGPAAVPPQEAHVNAPVESAERARTGWPVDNPAFELSSSQGSDFEGATDSVRGPLGVLVGGQPEQFGDFEDKGMKTSQTAELQQGPAPELSAEAKATFGTECGPCEDHRSDASGDAGSDRADRVDPEAEARSASGPAAPSLAPEGPAESPEDLDTGFLAATELSPPAGHCLAERGPEGSDTVKDRPTPSGSDQNSEGEAEETKLQSSPAPPKPSQTSFASSASDGFGVFEDTSSASPEKGFRVEATDDYHGFVGTVAADGCGVSTEPEVDFVNRADPISRDAAATWQLEEDGDAAEPSSDGAMSHARGTSEFGNPKPQWPSEPIATAKSGDVAEDSSVVHEESSHPGSAGASFVPTEAEASASGPLEPSLAGDVDHCGSFMGSVASDAAVEVSAGDKTLTEGSISTSLEHSVPTASGDPWPPEKTPGEVNVQTAEPIEVSTVLPAVGNGIGQLQDPGVMPTADDGFGAPEDPAMGHGQTELDGCPSATLEQTTDEVNPESDFGALTEPSKSEDSAAETADISGDHLTQREPPPVGEDSVSIPFLPEDAEDFQAFGDPRGELATLAVGAKEEADGRPGDCPQQGARESDDDPVSAAVLAAAPSELDDRDSVEDFEAFDEWGQQSAAAADKELVVGCRDFEDPSGGHGGDHEDFNVFAEPGQPSINGAGAARRGDRSEDGFGTFDDRSPGHDGSGEDGADFGAFAELGQPSTVTEWDNDFGAFENVSAEATGTGADQGGSPDPAGPSTDVAEEPGNSFGVFHDPPGWAQADALDSGACSESAEPSPAATGVAGNESDDGFGAFEDPSPQAVDGADRESDDGFGDFEEPSAEAKEMPGADSADLAESGVTSAADGERSAAVESDDGFGEFEAPSGEASGREIGGGDFDDFAEPVALAVVTDSTRADEGSDDGFGEFEEPPETQPADTAREAGNTRTARPAGALGPSTTSANLLEMPPDAQAAEMEAILAPLAACEGVVASCSQGTELGSSSDLASWRQRAAMLPRESALPCGGLYTRALPSAGSSSRGRPLISWWYGTGTEQTFLTSMGVGEVSAGPLAAEAAGHRRTNSGSASLPSAAEPQTPRTPLPRQSSISSPLPVIQAELQGDAPPSPSPIKPGAGDPFAASGPMMCLSEYLTPHKGDRSSFLDKDGVLPVPGGPLEDGSEYDHFGVYMAMQAAKNTSMPGTPAMQALESEPPAGKASVEPMRSLDLDGGHVAAVSQGLRNPTGTESIPDELPVSIAVPPPRSTHDSEDWDELFQRAESDVDQNSGRGRALGQPGLIGSHPPSSSSLKEAAAAAEEQAVRCVTPTPAAAAAPTGRPGSFFRAAQHTVQQAARIPARFNSMEEALQNLPDLSFMLPPQQPDL